MKTILHNYDIFPKVMLINEPVTITVKPLGKHAAFLGAYTVFVMSMAHGWYKIYKERDNRVVYDVTPDEDGCIRFTHTFTEESEYLIRFHKAGACEENQKLFDLSVYALNEDMRGRYPYRGDLHMHTFRSDGRQEPAVVAANYRKNGYDFMVVSDHYRYYPSLEAQEAYRDVPIEMNIVCGEEVHLPGNDVHIVNFGGEYSVNGLLDCLPQNLESDRRAIIDNPPAVITKEEYEDQVNALVKQLNIPDGIEKFAYASCVWAFDHIRKANGLGIYAHPYWMAHGPYQIPESLNQYMTETHPFDAYEVLGGENYFQMNGLQTIQYYEDLAKGISYPIVGSTDSHDSIPEDNRNALICSTFVFAPENGRKALIASVKDQYSVAVDTISKEYRIVGDLRLVKYTRFLLDEFTPLHDDLCYEEGRLMKAYAVGDPEGEAGLRFLNGRMDRFYKKYFDVL